MVQNSGQIHGGLFGFLGSSQVLASLLPCSRAYFFACLYSYLLTCLHAFLLHCLHAYMLPCLLAYMFTCLLPYLLACLLTFLPPCLPPCLIACLLAFFLASLLTYLPFLLAYFHLPAYLLCCFLLASCYFSGRMGGFGGMKVKTKPSPSLVKFSWPAWIELGNYFNGLRHN